MEHEFVGKIIGQPNNITDEYVIISWCKKCRAIKLNIDQQEVYLAGEKTCKVV